MSTVNYNGQVWQVTKGDTTTEYLSLKKLVDGKTGKGRPSKVKTELVEWLETQLPLVTPEQDAVNLEVEVETVVEE